MKTTINQNDFVSAFALSQYKDNFSRAALIAIFTDICETEAETDTEVELDVCVIACEWSEYESIMDYVENMGNVDLLVDEVGLDRDSVEIAIADWGELYQDQEDAFMGWLQEQTTVIKLDNGGFVAVDY